jgi:hypothetical protein
MKNGYVHWPSFRAGISTMSALAFLYLIRCSLHAAALKKNVPHVTRKPPEAASPVISGCPSQHSIRSFRNHSSSRHAKQRRNPISIGTILECGYGYSQLLTACTGGIMVAPAVAASLTLFKVRRPDDRIATYGSVLSLCLRSKRFRLVYFKLPTSLDAKGLALSMVPSFLCCSST